ncbi:site-specific integrase [Parabacteroides sp. AF17-28]|uniref:site-specific integrase n=1 Tax=Parabacteroides sp. AF17-28 TaxID=2292241 RepID=UPI000F004E6A|nr:site-specific integrase [Parabacteroides sp. AF17-28]RHR55687.1 integrase [Parabacteroides sp. AF17-28]
MTTNRTKRRPSEVYLFRTIDTLIFRRRSAGRDATADLYRAAGNWFRKFRNGRDLCLLGMTPSLVDGFIAFLQTGKKLKVNSVNSYLCALRAMYNIIIRELGYIPRVHPFAHVTIHPERSAKRAVDLKVFEQISALDLKEEPGLQFAADLCTFSFLACGMPFVDLAHLTHANIEGNTLVYNRTKTGSPIRIGVTQGMRCLLDKYASPSSPYLFPIFPPEGPVSYEHYKKLLHKYNVALKKLGARLRLPALFTSYVVRHSWATIAYRKYTPIALISQALGHTSERTTRHYLAQLDQSELSKANLLVIGTVDNLVRLRA